MFALNYFHEAACSDELVKMKNSLVGHFDRSDKYIESL